MLLLGAALRAAGGAVGGVGGRDRARLLLCSCRAPRVVGDEGSVLHFWGGLEPARAPPRCEGDASLPPPLHGEGCLSAAGGGHREASRMGSMRSGAEPSEAPAFVTLA